MFYITKLYSYIHTMGRPKHLCENVCFIPMYLVGKICLFHLQTMYNAAAFKARTKARAKHRDKRSVTINCTDWSSFTCSSNLKTLYLFIDFIVTLFLFQTAMTASELFSVTVLTYHDCDNTCVRNTVRYVITVDIPWVKVVLWGEWVLLV